MGGGGAVSLILIYHFQPLHRHLDISRVINAESSPLHIAGSRTQTLVYGRKSQTTKLRAFAQALFT